MTAIAARRCRGSRTKARPESYGTFSHLWQSVAQESASPKPAVRQGASCSKRDSPVFPREAIRAHIEKGRVNAVLTIDDKGNVTDVRIVSSEPPRVFDRAVRDTLIDWKCVAEGSKYQASVEINFTLKDE